MGKDACATTYFYDRLRAIPSGIIETAVSTFLLLIAVRFFEAGATEKALIAAGANAGLLLTPITVWAVSNLGARVSHAAAVMSFIGGSGFLLAALIPSLPVFIAGSIIGAAATPAIVPLLTQLYQENYPASRRGRLFSHAIMIRVFTAAVFAQLAGLLLSNRIERFPWLMVAFAVSLFFAGWCLWRIPSQPLVRASSRNPLRSLRHVGLDKRFRWTLWSWMFMGFANLMMLPLRIEYLANPRFGFELTVGMIALLTSVIPSLVRLVMSPIWGSLFDRFNFFLIRIAINIGFIVGIVAFFTGETVPGLVAGAVLFGVSMAGGDVAWSLWVTKIAPAEHVAEYMAVHTFFTGIRGVMAPFVAFYLVKDVPIAWMGFISGGMIFVACLMLLPETRLFPRRKGVPLAGGGVTE